jgi:hypothetical protein
MHSCLQAQAHSACQHHTRTHAAADSPQAGAYAYAERPVRFQQAFSKHAGPAARSMAAGAAPSMHSSACRAGATAAACSTAGRLLKHVPRQQLEGVLKEAEQQLAGAAAVGCCCSPELLRTVLRQLHHLAVVSHSQALHAGPAGVRVAPQELIQRWQDGGLLLLQVEDDLRGVRVCGGGEGG